MAFKLIPPEGVLIDVAKGEQAAEAVFLANHTVPEIARFGLAAVHRHQKSKRLIEQAGSSGLPGPAPSEEEAHLAEVFSLAWSAGLEACTGSQTAQDWGWDVIVPDGVFVRVPGASVDAIHRAMAAARDVFLAAGVAPQEAAICQHEQQVHDVRGFQGPEPSAASAQAAGVFYDAEQAAFAAAGQKVDGSYLSIEGFDAPQWQARMRTSEVLTWEGEPAAAA